MKIQIDGRIYYQMATAPDWDDATWMADFCERETNTDVRILIGKPYGYPNSGDEFLIYVPRNCKALAGKG